MEIITTKNLSFAYTEKKILKNIDFAVPKGNIVSLIGPNGCGKSTLLRCLAGILKTPRNSVFIDGHTIETYKTKQLAQKLAFLPQFQEKIRSISVYDLVAMGRSPYHDFGWLVNKGDRDKIEWAMDYMSLSGYEKLPVNALSGGERQRVWIAMTLAQDTPVILLDEPVTYMDLKHQQELLSVMTDLKYTYGKTIVTVFHDINHAMEVSDLVYMIKDGEVFAKGPPEKVITEGSISDVYDITAHVCSFRPCRRNVIVPQACKHRMKKEVLRNA